MNDSIDSIDSIDDNGDGGLIKFDKSLLPVAVGLNNIGSTCYFAAFVQSLLSCTSFVQEIQKAPTDNPLTAVICAHIANPQPENSVNLWRAFLAALATSNPVLCRRFAAGQQCADETFMAFVEIYENEPDIYILFRHRRRDSKVCPECGKVFGKYADNGMKFNLNTEDIGSELPEKLLSASNGEYTDADCVCPNCQARGPKKIKSALTMVPEIIVIMVRCYANGQRKYEAVNFPESFVLDNRFQYCAVAYIDHSGGLDSGHYVATCLRKSKESPLPGTTLEWVIINDSVVGAARDFATTPSTFLVFYHAAPFSNPSGKVALKFCT